MFLRSIGIAPSSGVDTFPFTLPCVRALRTEPLKLSSPATIFAGENGCGKSTLLEAIAIADGFNPEGGTRNFTFRQRPSESSLSAAIRLTWSYRARDGFFFRAESLFNLATNIEEMDRLPGASRKVIESYGGKSLHEQSHGESFLALMRNRFSDRGLFILDEPESALSPRSQLAFLKLMKERIESGSQFIIATHSPILLAYPGATLFELGEEGIEERGYEDLSHVKLYREFLKDRESLLAELGDE